MSTVLFPFYASKINSQQLKLLYQNTKTNAEFLICSTCQQSDWGVLWSTSQVWEGCGGNPGYETGAARVAGTNGLSGAESDQLEARQQGEAGGHWQSDSSDGSQSAGPGYETM